MEKRTYNPCDECPHGIDRRDGSGNDAMCRICEFNAYLKLGTIDHLRDIHQAEQDERLVVIPWAAGDVIYEADPAHGVVKHTFSGEPAWMMHSYAVDDAGNEWYDGWGSSDETPFYKTREEAEAAMALKGGEG